jgi:ElaB/YqjD/DUF883 family membrane-anchored ribosome-binding protein
MNEPISSTASGATSSTSAKAGVNSTSSSAKSATAEAAANNQAKAIAEAIEQLKSATNAVYQAFGAVGSASSEMAKQKAFEGRAKAQEMGSKAESAIAEKPLMYVGIAFAAGWLLSRLSK